ncbi:hypothetical protein RG47T_2646 [Mucilaginibacter polytrichastri]|uniref:Uncharacterized protein n=1 Tax=Mucilaginibacter polytrichastri TaxID=1302689 RepID=A0A1Q5ZZL3_9SPHI|nr:hypothetical protein RG47T_2646 [Mucilaginibacter polytrichastri]
MDIINTTSHSKNKAMNMFNRVDVVLPMFDDLLKIIHGSCK